MTRSRRVFSFVVLIGILTSVFALSAVAQEEGDSGSTEGGVTSESGLEPAVPIPEEAETETVADWTYRYLIPATLVLTVVVVVLTSIRYFTNVVRNRYRTVEE